MTTKVAGSRPNGAVLPPVRLTTLNRWLEPYGVRLLAVRKPDGLSSYCTVRAVGRDEDRTTGGITMIYSSVGTALAAAVPATLRAAFLQWLHRHRTERPRVQGVI